MGKLKDHLIGLEDDFIAMGEEIVNECEEFLEFTFRMDRYRKDWMSLRDDDEVHSILADIWTDYWSDYYDSDR
jgi:hypothetical protein